MFRQTWHSLLGSVLVFLGANLCAEETSWQKIEGCRLVDSPHNDGDSFEAAWGEPAKQQVFRLFFIDAPEKSPHSAKRRVEQGKYFGITGDNSEDLTMQAAYESANFVKEELSKPFTIYTRWQAVDSSGDNPAVRAFVETAGGKDLSELLVANGLAIIREGKAASNTPTGRNISETVSSLREMETKARLEKLGAWRLAEDEDPTPASSPPERTEFAATDRGGLFASAGHPVKVRGKVGKLAALQDGRITFLDFEGNKMGDFVGVIRADFLPAFIEQFPEGLEKALVGREVVLEGVITLYKDTPQIELRKPSQMVVVPRAKP